MRADQSQSNYANQNIDNCRYEKGEHYGLRNDLLGILDLLGYGGDSSEAGKSKKDEEGPMENSRFRYREMGKISRFKVESTDYYESQENRDLHRDQRIIE